MVSILLAIPPFLIRHRDHTPSPIESDILVHLKEALDELGVRTVVPQWPAGELRLSTDDLERIAVEEQCDAVIIEASYPKQESYLSNVDLVRLARRARIAAIVPDMWFRLGIYETLRSLTGLVETFLIYGNSELVKPIVKYGGLDPALARQFHDLGGFPVAKRPSAEKFIDFCYVGTIKKFRARLLKSIVGHSYMRSFILTAGREGKIGNTGLDRVEGFMEVLACTKTGLWTRAGESTRIDGQRYAAGYTARFHQYLATSVVPLYWGESVGRIFGRPEPPPVAGLVEGRHYVRVKDGRELKAAAHRICYEPGVYEEFRRHIDELYETRFSSRIIATRLLSVLGLAHPTQRADVGAVV
jgi:hypothetical protein